MRAGSLFLHQRKRKKKQSGAVLKPKQTFYYRGQETVQRRTVLKVVSVFIDPRVFDDFLYVPLYVYAR